MQGSAADALRLHVAECLAPVIQAAGMVADASRVGDDLGTGARKNAGTANDKLTPDAHIAGPDPKGLDGIYFKADERPPWLVIEAKYGKGKLNLDTRDGRQMGYPWIDNRLNKAAGSKEMADLMRGKDGKVNYDRAEIHIDADGSVTRREIPWG